MFTFVMVIVTSGCFFLAWHREVADTLHITDDTGQIVNIFAMTFRTLLKVMLANMAAFVAYRVRNVECEIIASFLSGNTEELAVLGLCKMLLKIEMQCRSTGKMLDIFTAMKTKFVDYVERLVFHNIEIAVVTVSWNYISVFPIPFCMFDADIFCRNHFAVEQCGL